MKKLIIILVAVFITTGAFAQKGVRGGVHIVRPHPVLTLGAYGPWYGYGYNPFWGYPYYGYPHAYTKPTKLDLQIADIKNDYQQKIDAARHDTSISKADRRKVVRDLKHDRDQQIIDAKRDYYKLG